MSDPINIDPAQINMNVPDTNVAAPPVSPGVEKISLGEFENYVPTGQKPVLDEKGTKLAKEQPAIVKKPVTTETAKDTNQNVKQETTEKLETKVEDQGEVADGEGKEEVEPEIKEEEEEFPIHDDKDDKIHGNSTRDYTGFSENEKKILKRLDIGRFKAIAPLLKTYKDAAGKAVQLATELESSKKLLKEGGIPESWHEHPEAYQLSREFQDLNTQYSYQEQADNHYQQQLLNIKQGKPWVALQWNKVTNQFEYSQPHEASDTAEMFVQRQLIAATNAKQNLDTKAAVLKQNHASSYERAASMMKQEVDNTIARMHPDAKPKPEDVALIEKVIPQQYKGHPLYYAVAQLGAIILAQGKMNQVLTKDQEQVMRLNQDIRKNGAAKTTPARRPSSPGKDETSKLRISEFGD
jgi:hypothetical protein